MPPGPQVAPGSAGFDCVIDPNECIASVCGCDEETFSCICTTDCGGGSCRPSE